MEPRAYPRGQRIRVQLMLVALAWAMTAGCGHSPTALRSRAASELGCHPFEIEVERDAVGLQQASGCSRKRTFHWVCDRGSCAWMPGEVKWREAEAARPEPKAPPSQDDASEQADSQAPSKDS